MPSGCNTALFPVSPGFLWPVTAAPAVTLTASPVPLNIAPLNPITDTGRYGKINRARHHIIAFV